MRWLLPIGSAFAYVEQDRGISAHATFITVKTIQKGRSRKQHLCANTWDKILIVSRYYRHDRRDPASRTSGIHWIPVKHMAE